MKALSTCALIVSHARRFLLPRVTYPSGCRRCKDGKRCISKDQECNHRKDCEDGSDETDCSEYNSSAFPFIPAPCPANPRPRRTVHTCSDLQPKHMPRAINRYDVRCTAYLSCRHVSCVVCKHVWCVVQSHGVCLSHRKCDSFFLSSRR